MARHARPMKHVLSFSVDLEFPAEVEAKSDVLMETIVDAIFQYDFHNRLLPGVPLPPRGERLIGSAVGLTKFSTVPDETAAFNATARRDEARSSRIFPTLGQVMEVSGGIDVYIEQLRDAQAAIWTAFNEMSQADNDAEFNRLKRKTNSAVKKGDTLRRRGGKALAEIESSRSLADDGSPTEETS